jgi:AcrR family transcriptional regulator
LPTRPAPAETAEQAAAEPPSGDRSDQDVPVDDDAPASDDAPATDDASGDGPGRRRWAGVPAERRRAERRALLVEAGLDLLGAEGTASTTVRAVCQRARLNPRYFYESFATLDDLVVGVYDAVVEEMLSGLAGVAAAAPPDARGQTRAVVDHIVRFVDEDRRRARVLYVEALGNEALNRRRVATGHDLVDLVARDAARRAAAPAPDAAAVERVGRVTAAVLVGGFTELLLAWLAGRIDGSREQLVDDATTLFLAVIDAATTLAADRGV